MELSKVEVSHTECVRLGFRNDGRLRPPRSALDFFSRCRSSREGEISTDGGRDLLSLATCCSIVTEGALRIERSDGLLRWLPSIKLLGPQVAALCKMGRGAASGEEGEASSDEASNEFSGSNERLRVFCMMRELGCGRSVRAGAPGDA